jgi:membrane protease YdiL (CAAX protease family)
MTQAIELGSRRVLRPGKLRWLRALGWMVLLAVAAVLLYGCLTLGLLWLGMTAAGETYAGPPSAPQGLRFAVTVIAVLALLGSYAAAVRWGEDRRVAELSLRALPLELVAGLVVGALLMVATIGVLWATGWGLVETRPVQHVLSAIRGAIESGVFEETLLRLIIFRLLWRAFGAWPALALSALLFGALHLGNPNATLFAALCIALEAGVLLAAFYVLTGRAWAPIGVHAGWNFTQGWVFGAAVSGGAGAFTGGPMTTQPAAGVPAVFSGGSFGPEASLPGLLICTAAGALVLWLAWRRGRFVPAGDAAAA